MNKRKIAIITGKTHVGCLVILPQGNKTIAVESCCEIQGEFERSLPDLIKYLLENSVKRIIFQVGGSLLLPSWFTELCTLLGIEIQLDYEIYSETKHEIYREAKQFVNKYPDLFMQIDYRAWVNGALTASAGAGNPKGSTLKCISILEKEILYLLKHFVLCLRRSSQECSILSQTDYDKIQLKFMKNCLYQCEKLQHKCWWTFGRVQKVFNIWIKYHVAWYYSKQANPEFVLDNIWISKYVKFIHAPIDRVILSFLHPQYTDYVNLGVSLLSWKRDLQEDRYLYIQSILRNDAVMLGYSSAIHYEMLIWSSKVTY